MPTWARPNYVLLLLMAVLGLLPIFNSGYAHPVIYPVSMALGIGVIFTVARLRKPGPGHEPEPPAWLRLPWLFLLAFISWAALGLVWSVDRYETLLALDEFLMGVFIFLLAATALSEADMEKLIRFNVIIGAAVALVGLLVFMFLETERVRSTFPHPNPFAAYSAMVILAGLFLFLKDRDRRLMVPLAIMGDAVVLSGSRGTWLVVLAVAAALVFRLPPRRRPDLAKLLILFLLVVVVTSMILTVLAPILQQHVGGLIEGSAIGRRIFESSILRPQSLGSSSSGRLSFWGVAWRMSLDAPFTGVGLGNFHTAYFLYWSGDSNYSRFTHNYYLQTAAETGWPGVLLLLGFLVTFFTRVEWRRSRDYPAWGLLGGSLVFLAHSVIDFSWNFPATAAVFWAETGMLAAMLGRKGETAVWTGKEPGRVAGCLLQSEAAATSVDTGTVAGGVKPSSGYPGPFARTLEARPAFPARFRAARLLNVAVLIVAVWLVAASATFWMGEVLADRGRSAVVREDLDTGLARLQQAVKLVPVTPGYRADLAWAYWRAGEEHNQAYYRWQARQQLEKAVELSPLNYSANLQVGELLVAEADYHAAEAYFRRAVIYGGFVPEPYADLGYLYLSQERYGEALEIMQRGLQMAGLAEINAPTALEKQRVQAARLQMHLGLARAYEALGNWSARRAELVAALEIDPENAVARRELSKAPPISSGR
ncbi:MAG: hypothetical protein D9V47_09475 [Clostridia bacterium]|nr:MAG: hypothetical protein D9V47_09475 [Clostridia bacterium]